LRRSETEKTWRRYVETKSYLEAEEKRPHQHLGVEISSEANITKTYQDGDTKDQMEHGQPPSKKDQEDLRKGGEDRGRKALGEHSKTRAGERQ
jgi:hypothetical protein